jgi:hypothetical protein
MSSFTPLFHFFPLTKFFKKKNNLRNLNNLYCKNNKNKLFFLSRSSWAIYSIALLKQEPNIFIPDYYCEDVIFLLRKLRVNIIFYKLKDDNSIDFDDVKDKLKFNKPDIFIYCNFFGKNCFDSILFDLKKRFDFWLIEDATHNLVPTNGIGYRGDIVIFSPYKFLAIPMGSIMTCSNDFLNKINVNEDEEFFINKILESKISRTIKNYNLLFSFKWIVKQFLKIVGMRKIRIENFEKDIYVKSINNFYHPKLDILSKNLMIHQLQEFHDILSKRLKMYGLIKKLINQEKIFFSKQIIVEDIDDETNPYMLEIKNNNVNLKNFYDYLKKHQLPVLTWPTLPKEVKQINIERNSALKKRLNSFFLPLHYQPEIFIKNLKKEQPKNIQIEFKIIEDSEWEKIYSKCENKNLINSLPYLETQNKILKIKNTKYKIMLNKEVIGIFVLLKKNFFCFNFTRINRGPLFLEKNIGTNLKLIVINKIIELEKKFWFNYFKFSPEIISKKKEPIINYNKNSFLFDSKGWSSSILDLRQNEDEIVKNLKQKWRNSLNTFNKYDVEIKEEVSKDSIEKILKYYKELQEENNFKGLNLKFLKEYLNRSKKLIYFAYRNNVFLGYICISIHHNSSTYLLGYSNKEGREMNVMNGLLWNAILKLKKKDLCYFDLGGLDDVNTPTINKFKLGINGKNYELVGNYNSINLI